jgi:hypothetical protein
MIVVSLASLLDCRTTTHPSELQAMAETYVIPMGDIPSRKLRKTVKVFIKEEDVCLYDDGGQEFGVTLEKNRLILKTG